MEKEPNIAECIINGEASHHSEATFEVRSPRDGTVRHVVRDANEADVDAAVEAARATYYREWKFFDADAKYALFERLIGCLRDRHDAILAATLKPGGKIPYNMKADGREESTDLFTRLIRFYMGEIGKDYGEVLEFGDEVQNLVVREPLGVVAVIPPWNSPAISILLCALPALVAGNTVVVKVPEQDPVQGLLTVEAFQEAGFPPGVVNAVAGRGPRAGDRLVRHPDVRLVSFSGAVPTGKKIMEAAAANLKRLHFNLGSKTAQLVLDDADIQAAAKAVADNAFPGQACSSVSRVFVPAKHKEAYLAALESELADKPAVLLIDAASVERCERYVARGLEEGQALVRGGSRPSGEEYAGGCWFEPTIFTLRSTDSDLYRDEIFGPVLSVLTYENTDEAVAAINGLGYGLLTSVWTRNPGKAQPWIRRLEMGLVFVNRTNTITPHAPWGGVKESGFGGRHYGKYGLEPFYEYKNIWIYPEA